MLLSFCLTLLLPIARVDAQLSAVERDLETMTLEQKIAQMFMVSFFGTRLAESELNFLREVQPGAVALFGRNAKSPIQVTQLTNAMQEVSVSAGGLPLLIAVDQEGGLIQHLQHGFTRFPAPMLWTATGDEDLAFAVGAAMAGELRAVGVNMNLAPVADLQTYLHNPIIKRRSFGNLPEQVVPILTQFVRGLQENGVVATVKHFPGHGDTSADSHLQLPVVEHDLDRLFALELQPFMAAFDAGVEVAMVAHIWFSALDAAPVPAALSPQVVQNLLRIELGYEGIIMTDALDMDAVDTAYSPSEAAIRAIQAGNDLIAIGAHVGTDRIRAVIDDVVAAVEAGRVAESGIDASVARIVAVKDKYGVLDWTPIEPRSVESKLQLAANDALVTRLFETGVTTLDPDGLLPLDDKVLIIYPGTRARIRKQCDSDSVSIEFLAVSESPSDDQIAEARRAAAEAEQVVLFSVNRVHDPRQRSLVRALPSEKTVLVALWDPTDIFVLPPVGAYVLGYSPMLQATAIICDVLLGKRAATGSMPFDFAN